MTTTVVIGKHGRARSESDLGAQGAQQARRLTKFWPVDIAYFDETCTKRARTLPDYRISFKLLRERRLTRDLEMDYGDFVIHWPAGRSRRVRGATKSRPATARRERVAVYVDDPIWRWAGRRWCHMLADSEEELHRFAASIGVHHLLYQGPPKTLRAALRPDRPRAGQGARKRRHRLQPRRDRRGVPPREGQERQGSPGEASPRQDPGRSSPCSV